MPEYPHHVIQRGNRNQVVFFSDMDRSVYLKLLSINAKKSGMQIWAYCLMDNHVHLIAVPVSLDSFAKGFAETHKKYTAYINKNHGWKGFLWQGRYISYPMDEPYLFAAIRYVELNPVRAGIVERAEDYPWSSAKAHVNKTKCALLSESFLNEEIKDWAAFLMERQSELEKTIFHKHGKCGKPLGDEEFITKAMKKTRKVIRIRQ
ncbi:MAG: transposase [Candidatus Aminicenantes bacterium]|nr:transposase [Candidatus Aminicenantes bacterium]